jgi:hypothetical protein
MDAMGRVRAWLGRRKDASRSSSARHNVFLLNRLIDLPTSFPADACIGGPEATHYLLDYNYIDRERSLHCLTALAAARQARSLDFSTRTLLLVAKGLHPLGAELRELLGDSPRTTSSSSCGTACARWWNWPTRASTASTTSR